MAGIKIANGTAASAEQTVDTDGNAHVTLPTTETQSGFACLATENDDGTVIGTRRVRALESTQDYRLRMGVDSVMFHHDFAGTVIARDRIQQNDTTATAAQTNGRLTLNSGSSVTINQGCNIRTYRTFPLFGSFSTYAEFWIAEGNPTATNTVSEWGFGYCSGVTVQLTDGIIFRRLSGGQLRAVIINNSVDVSAVDITTTNVPPRDESGTYDETEINHYVVEVNNDEARFWINDTLVARIPTISTSGSPTSASAQPIMARVYNPGAASTARSIILTFLSVQQGEMLTNKPWSHQMAGSGMGSYQIQPGTTSGPTVTRASANGGWPANTTALVVGTWTATSAPALNSLGGRWISPAISTLTSEADYPVFAYLNPAGTAALPGKTLYVTGINLGQIVALAAASTNGILLCLAAGVGGNTAVTNATEGAALVASRLVALDQVYFKSTAVVGDTQPGKNIDFSEGPLVVPPGCYFLFVVRPVGTVASNTLTVTGMCQPIGYFE
jgi:hypothetical protein